MDLVIYVLGDIDFTHRIMLGVTMLYQNRSMHLMAGTLLILFVMWSFIKWTLNPEKSPYPFREFAFGIIFYMIFGGLEFISPTFNVRLETDVYQGRTFETQRIENVPLLVAVPAWLTTNLFKGLRESISPLLYIPGEHTSSQYPGMGQGMDPLALLVDLNDLSYQSSLDIYLEKTVKGYVVDCFIPFHQMDGSPADADLTNVLKEPVDSFWTLTKVEVNWLFGDIYTETAPSGNSVSCNVLYDHISENLNGSYRDKVIFYLNSKNISSNDIQSATDLVLKSFTGSTTIDPYNFMVGKFMATYFNEAILASGVSSFEMMANKMMFEASQKRVFERAAESNLFIQIMVPIVTAIESFAFYIAPILMLLTVLGGVGISYIGKYLLLTLFINMWSFIKIFTDFFMLLTVHKGYGGDLSLTTTPHPFSLFNQYHTYMEFENFLAIASSLTMSIPLFAMFLLYGGVHSMMGVMRSLQGGSVDAANVAPTMASSMQGGTMQAGDTSFTHIASTGKFAETHSVGSSGTLGTVNASTGLDSVRNQQLSSARSNVAASLQSAGDNINDVFSVTSTGGTTESGGDSKAFSLNSANQKVNSVAQGVAASSDETASERASGTGRLAAAVALQLKSPGGGGKSAEAADKLTEAELMKSAKSVGMPLGIGADLSAFVAQQYEQGNGATFKQQVTDALSYIESSSSSESYAEGVNWSKLDSSSDTGAQTTSAANVRSDMQSLQEQSTLAKQISDTIGDTNSTSATRTANWAVAEASFNAMGAGAAIDQVWDKLPAQTQEAILGTENVGSKDELKAQWWKDNNGDVNAAQQLKSATEHLSKRQEYGAAADIYEAVAPFAGVHGHGFEAVAKSFDRNAGFSEKISQGGPKGDVMGRGEEGNYALASDPATLATDSENIKKDAQGRVNTHIDPNRAVDKGKGDGLLNNDGTVKEQAGLGVSLLGDSQKVIEDLTLNKDQLLAQTNRLETSDAMRAGVDLMDSVTGGIQSFADYMKGNQSWGQEAGQVAATGAAIAAQTGSFSGAIVQGLTSLMTYGSGEFAQLQEGVSNNDPEALKTLSSMNDAALFMTNTGELGADFYNGLSDELKSRSGQAIHNVESMVGGLNKNEGSALSSGEMNAISEARYNGDITDNQAGVLIDFATDSGEQTVLDKIGVQTTSDEEKSTLFSAAFGNIGENPVLSNIVTDSKANIAEQDMFDVVSNDPGSALLGLKGESFGGMLVGVELGGVWDKTAQGSTSQIIEGLQKGGDSEVYQDYAKENGQDLIGDNLGVVQRAESLQYDPSNQTIQGANVQLLDAGAVAPIFETYADAVSERSGDGYNTSYSDLNEGIISAALGTQPTIGSARDGFQPNAADEALAGDGWFNTSQGLQQNANSLAVLSAYSSGHYDFSERDGDMSSDGARFNAALRDLGDKARESGIVIDNKDYTPTERPDTTLNVKK